MHDKGVVNVFIGCRSLIRSTYVHLTENANDLLRLKRNIYQLKLKNETPCLGSRVVYKSVPFSAFVFLFFPIVLTVLPLPIVLFAPVLDFVVNPFFPDFV